MSETLPPTKTTDPSLVVGNTTGSAELDTEALNRVTERALEPQVYFGKGLDLTEHDRQQFSSVVSKAETILEPRYADPHWAKLIELEKEGQAKGVLIAFAPHEGTRVPLWCIDGGAGATVRKVMRTKEDNGSTGPGIEVPSHIFNLFHWKQTVDALQGYATVSDETIKGRSTKDLGMALTDLVHLLKESETKAEVT